MKIQRDKLQQYQKRVTVITARETAVARQCLARNDKPKALLALRRKKYQESLLAKTDAQLEQLQALCADVEFAAVQKDVMFGLQQGTSVLKEIQREMGGVEGVEKLLGESEEARAYQREISELLGGKLANEEEDEVEEELERMRREVESVSDTTEQTVVPTLPEAPTGQPQETEDEEILARRKKARARERQAEQAAAQAAEPMLA
ncbi:Vacuolar protein sorting-associated protein 20 [Agyrium rufum]|nr:Vacuolar protein sorting-associated protein 20 [Agyrium rufum]